MTRVFTGMLIVGLLALGCAKPTQDTREQDRFGGALRANNEAMIANPQAGQQGPVEGLDSRSAEHVLENYSEGQRNQEHTRAKRRMGDSLDIGTRK